MALATWGYSIIIFLHKLQQFGSKLLIYFFLIYVEIMLGPISRSANYGWTKFYEIGPLEEGRWSLELMVVIEPGLIEIILYIRTGHSDWTRTVLSCHVPKFCYIFRLLSLPRYTIIIFDFSNLSARLFV